VVCHGAPRTWRTPEAPIPTRDGDDARLDAALLAVEPTPTTESKYSNLGAALLGRVLEHASGKDYATLLRERIAEPLRLGHTTVEGGETVQGHDAGGREKEGWVLGSFDAAGGIHSTSGDLATWVRAHFDPAAPTAKAMDLAVQPRYRKDQNAIGLLWHRNDAMVWHNGQTGGFHSLVAFTPQNRPGVVVLGDTATELVDEIGFAALQLLQGQEPPPLPIREAKQYPGHFLVALAGQYGPVEVVLEQESLWLKLQDQGPFRMWAESPTNFYLLEAPVEIEISQGRLSLEQAGLERQSWPKE